MNIDQLESERAPASDEALAAAEEALGVKLPDSYKEFVKQVNGAYVGGYLPVTDYPGSLARYIDDDLVSVGYIFGIAHGYPSVHETTYMIAEWGLPEDIILLDGEGHTWLAFDYRNSSDEPPIIFIESDSGEAFEVARSFEEFFEKLLPHEAVFDKDGNRIGL